MRIFFWTNIAFYRHIAAMFSLLLSTMLMISPSHAATVKKVTAHNGMITISFDDVVHKASVFTLSGPNRIALDVEGIDSLGGLNRNLLTNDVVIHKVRMGQYDQTTARLVFDLDKPGLVSSGKFSADGKTFQLTLRQADNHEFTSTLRKGRQIFLPPAKFRSAPPKKDYAARARIKKSNKTNKGPKIYGPNDSSLPLVVIDAGHGGHDPGAISPHGGQREKEITLAIAKKTRDKLAVTGRIRVALTRENDKFLVLQDRFGIARNIGADLFISIHADAAGSHQAHGGTVYTLSEVASDREAQKLAARENKSDIINGVNLGGADDNVSSILIDLTQRETMNVSADFAKILLREAKPNMRLRSHSHRFASFVVLKAPDTPSILFETGYLTNEKDVKFLSTAEGQSRVADSITKAAQAHFARRVSRR